jgi:hypothetical protein
MSAEIRRLLTDAANCLREWSEQQGWTDATVAYQAELSADIADKIAALLTAAPAAPSSQKETHDADTTRSQLSPTMPEMRDVLRSDRRLRPSVQAEQESGSQGAERVQGLTATQEYLARIEQLEARLKMEVEAHFRAATALHYAEDELQQLRLLVYEPAAPSRDIDVVQPAAPQEERVKAFVHWVKTTPHDSLSGDSRTAYDAQVRVLEQLLWFLEGKDGYLNALVYPSPPVVREEENTK